MGAEAVSLGIDSVEGPARPVFGVLPIEVVQPQSPAPNLRLDTTAYRESVLGITEISLRPQVCHQLTLGLPETPRPTFTLRIPVIVFSNVHRQQASSPPITTPRRQGEGGLEPKPKVNAAAFRRRSLSGN